MTDFSSVKGKVAVVTGAASGMGKSIASLFAENGMKVVLADFNEEAGQKITNDLKAKGCDVVFCKTDVSKESDVQNMVNTAVTTWGRLDGIVNNAGIGGDFAPLHEFSVEEYDKLMAINQRGVFMGMKYGIEAILKTKSTCGFVICTASLGGLQGSAGVGLYTASKHAVVGLVQNAALDYAKHNITVNALCPGAVRTGIWMGLPDEEIDKLAADMALSPNGRVAEPWEIGHMALFLATDMARYISGAAIRIDAAAGSGKAMDIPWRHPEILE